MRLFNKVHLGLAGCDTDVVLMVPAVAQLLMIINYWFV